jgi:primosomal protein N' (replication factor Y)
VLLLQGGLDALERDEQTAELSLKERQLLRILRDHQALALKKLAQHAGFEVGEAELRRLVVNQWVQLQHQLAEPTMTPRFQKSVALQSGTVVESLKLTAQQQRVVQALTTRTEPVAIATLLEELSISPSALNSLQRRGVIVFSSETVRRDPLKSVATLSSSGHREHTSEQIEVLKNLQEALSSASFVPALLHGVTGSGKTEVYLCLIEATLQRRKTALMLMPEIGLTPRVAEEFRQRWVATLPSCTAA